MISYQKNIRACRRCNNSGATPLPSSFNSAWSASGGPRCPAGGCVCAVNHLGIEVNAKAGSCPIGLHVASDNRGAAAAVPLGDASTTAELWLELHHWAIAITDPSAAPAWIAAWSARIPCGDCRRHWSTWYAANPADLSSPAGMFEWSIHAHNAVNRKLGRPEWTVQQGIYQYSKAVESTP